MKKLTAIFLICVLLMSAMTAFAGNTEIIINGEKATIAEGMGSIVNKDSRIFVPVRFLLEYFDFQVSWEDETQTVLGFNEEGESFFMQIGNKKLFFFDKNGAPKNLEEMDVAPYLNYEEGRTYIPLRFIAEAMGYTVDWDQETDTAILVK